MKKIIHAILLAVLVFGLAAPTALADVWEPPPSNPPSSNRPRPLDESAEAQTKAGNLTIEGSLDVEGSINTTVGTPAHNFGDALLMSSPDTQSALFIQGNIIRDEGLDQALVEVENIDGSANSAISLLVANRGAAGSVALQVQNLTGGWAGYFYGPVGITGGLQVDGSTFYVDAANNRVGFGTTQPQEAFTIYGSANAVLGIRNDSPGTVSGIYFVTGAGPFSGGDGGGAIYGFDELEDSARATIYLRRVNVPDASNGIGDWPILFYTSQTDGANYEKMRITGAGNVGIGTTAPLSKLSVGGAGNGDHTLHVQGGGNFSGRLDFNYYTYLYASGGPVMGASSGETNALTIGGYYGSAWPTLVFATNGSEKARINSSGQMGIGLNPSAAYLQVKDNNVISAIFGQTANRQLAVYSGSSVYPGIGLYGGSFGLVFTGPSDAHLGATGGTGSTLKVNMLNGQVFMGGTDAAGSPTLFVDGDEVGIDTIAPGYKLDVQGGQVNASNGFCIAGDCINTWAEVGGGAGLWTDQGTYIQADNNTGVRVYDTTGLGIYGGLALDDDANYTAAGSGDIVVWEGLARICDGDDCDNDQATTDGDLYVEDDLEVDGSLCIEGSTGSCDSNTDGNLEVEDGSMCIGDNGCTAPTGDGDLLIEDDLTVGGDIINGDGVAAVQFTNGNVIIRLGN